MTKIISGLAILAILAAAGSSCSSQKAADAQSNDTAKIVVDTTVAEVSVDSVAQVAVDSTIAE